MRPTLRWPGTSEKHPKQLLRTRQSKVADLNGAVLIHQAVRRLQVAVVDARGVEIFHAHQQVVEQRVDVEGRQAHVLRLLN